jgi:hypothetical protein
MIKIILGALAYIIPSMPWGYFWHLSVFKKTYDKWKYFGDDKSVPLAFVAMVIQGAILSAGYVLLPVEHRSVENIVAYVSVMGIFFWSRVVIPSMAQHAPTRNLAFFLLETAYIVGQFTLFGILLWVVYWFV